MTRSTVKGKNIRRMRDDVLDFIAGHRAVVPLSFVALYIILFTIFYTKTFTSLYNISSVLLELAVPIIMVIGVTLVLVSGEIDLSIGYNVLFSNILFGILAVYGVPVILAIIITIACAAAMGLMVGFLVTKNNVNSFIATLASGMIFYGVALFLYTSTLPVKINGQDTLHLSSKTTLFAQYQLVKGLNFQIPIIYALIICLIFLYLMTKSKFFVPFYYVGANSKAAELSGIKTKMIKTVAFVISAALSSFGGVVMCGRLGMTGSTVGIGWEMQIITGAVVGGVSLKGGRGSLIGAFCGMLFVICLNNGMRIANVDSKLYKIVYGLILLFAVLIDTLFSKRKIVG